MTAISTSGHPALRRTRTAYQLDSQQSQKHVGTVRCAAPISTHHIWREIWLDRLRISRGWWVGSTPLRAAVIAQPVRSETCSTPRDLRCALAEADASFTSTMQARGTDWVARRNGCGQIARSPTAKRLNPLELSYLSQIWRHRIHHGYHSIVAPCGQSLPVVSQPAHVRDFT